MSELQSATDVLMIRPVRFIGNPQTSSSNVFQQIDAVPYDEAQRRALTEFDALAEALRRAGVGVHVVEDTPEPHTPDSIFPNNWVSFHADGTVVLYPMLAPNRRLERRADLLEALSAQHGFFGSRVIDLTHYEQEEKFLEGTGSLVLDRINRVAYACVSPRTDLDVLGDFAQQLDYDVVAFEATDSNGYPIYHTNVLMSVGTRFAAVCAACIREDAREAVLERLRVTGRALLELSYAQMHAFAGNLLEVRSDTGALVAALSQQALDSLSAQQRAFLMERVDQLIAVPIPTIETLGGGSVRCMLAEVHLPKKHAGV
jgi:hypothetical protein